MANIDLEEGRRQGREEVSRELLAALDKLLDDPTTPPAARPYVVLVGKWIRRKDFQSPRKKAVDTRSEQLGDLKCAAELTSD